MLENDEDELAYQQRRDIKVGTSPRAEPARPCPECEASRRTVATARDAAVELAAEKLAALEQLCVVQVRPIALP